MKRTIGILLWLAGHAIKLLVLMAGAVYLFGAVVWMHAPLLGAIVAAAPMALAALGLAWLCRRIGKRLRDATPAQAASGGHSLTVFEQDMSADGSTSWRDPKDEPERVNGLPARLVVLEDPSRTAVSLLSWMEGRRDYQL